MAKAVARTKAKKKRWYPLMAPKLFNEQFIGEVYVEDPQSLVGRKMSVNMRDVTGNPKMQNMDLYCQVKEVKGDKAYTFARGFSMNYSSVKRYVRKGRDRIDDSFIARTKDGIRMRVKPMAVTASNTSKEVQTKIRNTAKDVLKKEFAKKNFNQVLDNVLNFNLQKDMKNKLGKTHPVRNFEIRIIRMLDEDKVPVDIKKKEKAEKGTEKRAEERAEPAKKEETEAEKSEKEEKPKKAAKAKENPKEKPKAKAISKSSKKKSGE